MRRSTTLLLLASGLAVSLPVHALDSTYSSSGTDELISDLERVPPAVLFVIDRSVDMDSPCGGSYTSATCFEDAKDIIVQTTRHFDFAEFGVVGTIEDANLVDYYQVAPVGSTSAEIASALSSLTTGTTDTSNVGEVLQTIGTTYLANTTPENWSDDDLDGFTGDWDETPIGYPCSTFHVIVLTTRHPEGDDGTSTNYGGAAISGDIDCSTGPLHYGDDCLYDNVVSSMYNFDFSSESGTQRVVVHTIALDVPASSEEDLLFQNAANQTAGEGLYTNATTKEEALAGTLSVFSEIQSGIYSRSTPIVSADGAYLIYTFYEVYGSNPLFQGHIRAYAIDNDPNSATFGQVIYEGDPAFGGAVWDGGDLLVSRPVYQGETQTLDNDGFGQRDIYFYDPSLDSMSGNTDRRLPYDSRYVSEASSLGLLNTYIDTTNYVTTQSPSDFDKDGDVEADSDDLQALVDFVRGLTTSEFRYLDVTRGSWKLGDSPYSIPIAVTPRNNSFSTDSTYRLFLEDLEARQGMAGGVPAIVLLPANDGMLHAFALEDDLLTSGNEAGEELWAWIPHYAMRRGHDEEWANSLTDLATYGRTFLFDGTPVVEDVWTDDDGSGDKAADGSEWHRVVVVQQGMGGPTTLALDITTPMFPTFLWEQTNTIDTTAMGYTLGRPVIFDVYDASDTGSPKDRWVAMWGGGQAVGFTSTSTDYFNSTEANLYMWNIADTPATLPITPTGSIVTQSVGYDIDGNNVGNAHPDLSTNGGGASGTDLQEDLDSNLEHSYISAALAAVDMDGDGDGDVVYFPVTSSYRPSDEGGGGPVDVEVPGSSWMYKAIIHSEDANGDDDPDLEWCKWYDPIDGTDGSNGIPNLNSTTGESHRRPEVYYAATTAWLPDAALGVYWGTGTPFDRSGSNTGYFFAMYDAEPDLCSSTAQPIPCTAPDGSENPGYYALNYGEGLTGDPLVYAGVVYFTTYEANADRCEVGTGRVYGLRYDDCTPGIDTNGDGTASTADEAAIEAENYVSGITVSSYGTLYYGSSNPTVDGSSAAMETFGSATDPFLGTTPIAWMEVY